MEFNQAQNTQQDEEARSDQASQDDFGLYFGYWNLLNETHKAGHKVDKELGEVVQLMREQLGIVDHYQEYFKEVRKEAKITAQSLVLSYIRKLEEENVLTFQQVEIAKEEVWKIKAGQIDETP